MKQVDGAIEELSRDKFEREFRTRSERMRAAAERGDLQESAHVSNQGGVFCVSEDNTLGYEAEQYCDKWRWTTIKSKKYCLILHRTSDEGVRAGLFALAEQEDTLVAGASLWT